MSKDKELIEKLEEAEKFIKAIKHGLERKVRDQTQLEVINMDAKTLAETSKEIEMITQYLE
jgi:PP-loop superfamily ATP-utilizing enzyme